VTLAINKSWENEYSWLRYSPSQDCAYCSLYIAFQVHPSENPRYNEFVTVHYKDWKNALGDKRGRLALHSNSERHLKALEKSSLLFTKNIKFPSSSEVSMFQFPRNAILRLPRVIITSIRDKRLALVFFQPYHCRFC
jgi:hypothetical protein